MLKASYWWPTAAAILAVLPAEGLGVHLRGRIVQVGFPGSGSDLSAQGADHYRVGRWTPVRVELTNDEGDLFNGRIEVRQADCDGDEIVAKRSVSVRDTRTEYLYVPGAAYASRNQFIARVFDENGRLAPLFDAQDQSVTRLLPPREVYPVGQEARVILDISERPINQLASLPSEPGLIRELFIARSSPAALPDNVAGLDMADVIIWDGADPAALRDPAQLRALVEWAKRGGTLILGVNRNWEIVQSKLGGLLPARLSGVATTDSVPELNRYVFGLEDDSPPLPLSTPLNYCPVTMAMLAADASAVIPPNPQPKDRLLVTRRPCGTGEVILVAAELREMLALGTHNAPLLRQVLAIRTESTDRNEQQSYYLGDCDLFQYVDQCTAFSTTVEVYFLFAFAFVIVYVLIATAGSWTWLKRKGTAQHAWTAFAVIAILASAASLGAVQLIRGIGKRVEELTVVDGRAGSADADATCFFGLKTASHTALDLCVPTDWLDPDDSPEMPASLRPLALDPDSPGGGSVYSAGQPYEAIADLGVLQAVPLRATLKQFEAVWHGQMNGRLDASLRRGPGSLGDLQPDSWIQNNLNTDLDKCYLLLAARNFFERRPLRLVDIFAYPIGKLPAGQRVQWATVLSAIAAEQAKQQKPRRQDLADLEAEPGAKASKLLLSDTHLAWLESCGWARFRRGDPTEVISLNLEESASALLLLSTYDEIDHAYVTQNGQPLKRSQGQRLDRSSYLTRDLALFIGFSEDPGPARLCWRPSGAGPGDWKAIHPSTSRVMYRLAVPVASP